MVGEKYWSPLKNWSLFNGFFTDKVDPPLYSVLEYSVVVLSLSIHYYFYWSLYSKELIGNCKERVFQNFLLDPVNVALGVTGEFVRLGVAEFGSSGVIIGVFELLTNSISRIGETRLSLYRKNES